MPQDPASGAARSLKTICEMLAGAGFQVRALATTATERGAKAKPLDYLQSIGVSPTIRRPTRAGPYRPELLFTDLGVDYRLLDVANQSFVSWEKLYGRNFDLLFDEELRDFQPDVVFTFGGSAGDVRRRHRARNSGAKVVFGLRNMSYLAPGSFEHVDAILTPSQYVSDRYRSVLGVESTPIATAIEVEDVVADERQAIFVTIVNPSLEKGAMFTARLLEEISVRRPEIAFLVIEARGTAGLLARAGLAGGFDLRRHENILVSEAVPKPKDIYAGTRVLLVPSLWEEPGARVIAEALVNGIPALVSDRGGQAEMLQGGGFVLHIAADITPESRVPPPPAAVQEWMELILRLADDDEFYEQACARAREAAKRYDRAALTCRYVEFFENALRS